MEFEGEIKLSTFQSQQSSNGPHLLVFGAIHGDEVCGPAAIRQIEEEFSSGMRTLTCGTLTLVPVANPRAYLEKKRFVEDNLNRIFSHTDAPESYEARIANKLCALVDKADVLLDIHSSFAPAPVNVFIDYPTPQNVALAAALSAEYAVYDWPKVYEENTHGFSSHTTDRYAYEAGKTGILIEAGQHTDPNAVRIAHEAILRTLIHLGMLTPLPELAPPQVARAVHMTEVFARASEHDVFAAAWTHLQILPAGTTVATRATGEDIVVDEESVILFPKTYTAPGDEWFYLGTLTHA